MLFIASNAAKLLSKPIVALLVRRSLARGPTTTIRSSAVAARWGYTRVKRQLGAAVDTA